jgi:hypothetical protein
MENLSTIEKDIIDEQLYLGQTKKFKTMWPLKKLESIMLIYKNEGMHKASETYNVTTETIVRLAQKFDVKIKKDVLKKVSQELKDSLSERIKERQKENEKIENERREYFLMHYYLQLRLSKNKLYCDKSDDEIMVLANKLLNWRP